ncbi:MAG TPA: hypothetical protein VGG65_03290 [Thermoanaerobaculia bacterium]
MDERRKAKWSGWLVAAMALVLAGVLSISGASREQTKVPSASKASVVATPAGPQRDAAPARSETDICELQLD